MQAFAAEKEIRKVKTNTIKTKMHQKKKIHRSWSKEKKGVVLWHFSSEGRGASLICYEKHFYFFGNHFRITKRFSPQ